MEILLESQVILWGLSDLILFLDSLFLAVLDVIRAGTLGFPKTPTSDTGSTSRNPTVATSVRHLLLDRTSPSSPEWTTNVNS